MNKYDILKNKIASVLKGKTEEIQKLKDENAKLKKGPQNAVVLNVEQVTIPDGKIRMDEPVEVKNFPKKQDVEIKNLDELAEKLHEKAGVQKVEVVNHPDPDRVPSWIPTILATTVRALITGIDKITDKVLAVRVIPDKSRPIPVMLVDRNGKAVSLKGGSDGQVFLALGSGGNGGTTGGALETTQQQVLDTLQNLEITVPPIEVDTSALETLQTAANGLLTDIKAAVDTLETLIAETNTAIQDTLDHYKANDVDDSGSTKYYGFTDKAGNWYILKNDSSANTYRYVKGSGNYETAITGAWATRASQSYDYFHNVF